MQDLAVFSKWTVREDLYAFIESWLGRDVANIHWDLYQGPTKSVGRLFSGPPSKTSIILDIAKRYTGGF